MSEIAIAPDRFTDLRTLPLSLALGSFDAEILGWGYFEPRWWRNYLHTHSYFEICYAFAGRGLFRIAAVDYPVCAGEVFVAKPGEAHEIISSEDDPLGIYFWWYTLVPARTGTNPVDVLLQAFIESRCWVSSRVPAMQATLDLLTLEITHQQAGYPLVIQGLVTKLLLDTARAVTDVNLSERVTTNPDEAVVRQMTRYLHDNYNRPIQVRDVAAQVHLSERHTNRLFRRVMGLPIKDYLMAYRLKIAAQLLLNRNLTVTEIAHAIGYHDVRYFIALFRQRTGLTPAAFRRRGGTAFL